MTALLIPADALTEAERIIQLLEQHYDEFPFAEDLLATYRPAYQELVQNKATAEHAIAAWQTALAQRWDCEIAGYRLYKQIYQQLVAFYGSADAPEVQIVAHGITGEHRTPTELLADLRRMEAVLRVSHERLPFAAQRLSDLGPICAALNAAIEETSAREAARRISVLEQRIVREAQRRLNTTAHQAFMAHYGSYLPIEIAEAFG